MIPAFKAASMTLHALMREGFFEQVFNRVLKRAIGFSSRYFLTSDLNFSRLAAYLFLLYSEKQ